MFMMYFMVWVAIFVGIALVLWIQHKIKLNKAMNEEIESLGSRLEKSFEYEKECATENPNKKYNVDMATITKVMNLQRQLINGNIARGEQMQHEDGAQKDWAIAGGIASGLAGGAAGVAVAMKTMQDNAESTRKHHEEGKRMVQEGLKDLQSNEASMNAIRYAVNNRRDHFTYTSAMPELLDSFDVKNATVSVLKNEIITHKIVKRDLSIEEVKINAVKFYNEVGYFKAKISIKNNRDEKESGEKRHRIDGGFRVDLYDGEVKFATGYVTDGRWSVESHSDIGFKNFIDKNITFKICNAGKLIPGKAYNMRLEEPNLWLVEM